MIETNSTILWHCVAKTVRGFSHLRNGLPNQDAMAKWRPKSDSGLSLPLILAIADGHGSAKSFRSHIGSNYAVQTAIKIIQENIVEGKFYPSTDEHKNLSLATVKDFVQNKLPERIVKEWQQLVDEHYEENAVTTEEWQKVEEKGGGSGRKVIDDNLRIIYGSTLLAVVITEAFIVYLQLGDGDILCVDSSDKVYRPLLKDEKLIANETTSLCMREAWTQFRVHVAPYPEHMPSLILLATDGYSNSFSSETGFEQVGKDYCKMIVTEGMKSVEQQLEHFLSETSQKGSGDDITLGLIKRLEEGDRDYQHLMIVQQDKRITAQEKNMNMQKEEIRELDSRLSKLENGIKKNNKALHEFKWIPTLSRVGFF